MLSEPVLAAIISDVRDLAQLLLRVPVPWVFVLSYLIGVVIERLLPSGAKRLPGIYVAGEVLFVIGAIVAGWAWLIFRRHKTTTTPGETSAKLVTWGPYCFSRNPMYIGLILAYVGEAGLLKQVWPLVLLPLALLYLNSTVIPLEEQKLEQAFPQEYDSYRARVRRWL
jgi:protein-S-isoprenylcysteine O-methyltransferase Ste14